MQRKKHFLIPDSDSVLDHIPATERNMDWYSSIFLYEEEHKDLLEKKKSLAGTVGLKTNRLIFDFDIKKKQNITDIGIARTDANELLKRLKDFGLSRENVQVCFSGNKGFSVEVDLNQEITRDQFKNIVFNLAGDLKTFDDKIHDYQRIFRIPLTAHQESKLYKIPLTDDQLVGDLEAITETAKNPIGTFTRSPALLTGELDSLKDTPHEVAEEVIPEDNVAALDFSGCPRWLSREKYALLQGYIPETQRNHALMILASTMRNQGFDKEHTLNILKTVVQKREKLLGIPGCTDAQIHREVLTQVYGANWKGGTYGKDDPLLVNIREKFGLRDVINDSTIIGNPDLFSSFYDYAVNIDKNTITTGLPIDDQIRLTIGMSVALLGAPSSGKTSVALNMLKHTSNAGIKSLFFSLDMHRSLIVQKQLQMCFGHDADTIFKNVKEQKMVGVYKDRLNKEFANVSYCCRSGLDIDGLRKEVEDKQRELNGELKLVVVDYLECVKSQFADQTASTGMVADGLKDIANDLNVCVVVLVQPPKITGGARYPLTNMYQIKGSSMVAQAMRAVIGIYRMGFSPDNFAEDKYISFVCLKNTMGELFTQDCYWNGKKASINPIFERYDLEEVKQLRAELLNENKRNNDI